MIQAIRKSVVGVVSSVLMTGWLLAAGGGCRAGEPEGAGGETKAGDIQLRSTAFREGASIPRRHTCDGADLSPPLAWEGLPEGTVSLALICDDPDAPAGTWVHWVLVDLPAETRELAEGLPKDERLPGGAVQGTSSFRRTGYGGPCPPEGPAHRYFFKIYALDRKLRLGPDATKADALEAMEGHILAQGRLMGKYGR